MEVRRLTNLACLVATVVAGGGLPATTLKVRAAAGRWAATRCRFACINCPAVAGVSPAIWGRCGNSRRRRSSPWQAADFAAALPAREVLFWRIFFEHLLGACKTRDDSSALFARWVGLPAGGRCWQLDSAIPHVPTLAACPPPSLPACLAHVQHRGPARAQAAACGAGRLPAPYRGALAGLQGAGQQRAERSAAGRAAAAAASRRAGAGVGGVSRPVGLLLPCCPATVTSICVRAVYIKS